MFLRNRLFNPLWRSCLKMNKFSAIGNQIYKFPIANFSKKDEDAAETEIDWEKLDAKSTNKLIGYYMESKLYNRIMDDWKRPLAKKKLRRERKLERDAAREPPAAELQKLVVHDINKPVTYPQDPYGIYAIVEISGKQFKVTKDCTVLIEKTGFKVGDQIIIDQVLMIGTKDYTSIGRPFVETSKVYATVEEESRTEKVIIFKKRRRKTYQKNQGHRQTIQVIRIDKIVHKIGEEQVL